MEFTFDLKYDQKAMTSMAKAMRVGLQEEQDKRSRIIGWIFVVLGIAILLFSGKRGWAQIVAAIVLAGFIAYLIWQDQINGFFALKKLPEKMRTGLWLFRDDGYFSNTDAGESDYSYENIFAVAEYNGYIFLVFHNGTAQIVELSTIKGGSADDFRRLLRKKTSLTIQKIG